MYRIGAGKQVRDPASVGRRTRRAVMQAIAFGAVGAACGSDDLPGVPRIGTAQGKVIYATWGAPGLREAEHWTLLSFEKNYTDLKVDVVIASDDPATYTERLRAMVASGTDPDVMRLPGPDAPSFYASAVTRKLDAVMRRDGFRTDVLAGPFDGATYAKAWHALPRGRAATWGVFYDRDRFSRTGISDPDPSWSWEQMLDIARRLTDRDADAWGLSIDPIAAFPLPWIWGAGADDVDRGGSQPQWGTAAVKDALRWVHALRHVHRVAPPAGVHAGIDALARGRVARLRRNLAGGWPRQRRGTPTWWQLARVHRAQTTHGSFFSTSSTRTPNALSWIKRCGFLRRGRLRTTCRTVSQLGRRRTAGRRLRARC
ncbi:MAG: extracellular solute-binding protein [Proteobacteria bacterium]|nr:extracellular solute-binding protein [Pseudomonadota bacterium]